MHIFIRGRVNPVRVQKKNLPFHISYLTLIGHLSFNKQRKMLNAKSLKIENRKLLSASVGGLK